MGFVSIGIGLVAIAYGLYLARMTNRLCNWQVTSGWISRCECKAMGEGHYGIDIAYSYQVDGQAYTGKTIAIGRWQFSEHEAKRRVGKYPAGSAVEVWYDPERREECFLEPMKNRDSWPIMAVGCVFIGAGILSLLTGQGGGD